MGQVLDGRYEILAPLAEGGMGAVYLARRVLLGDDVAIKVILADAEGPEPLERFVRESRACAQLRHPNIVSIFDYNADDPQRPFLVMELLSGPSLKDELAERGRFPVEELQRIIPPVCSALALAHTRGIVHRDLKPANIVAHEFGDGRIHKVVDFGVATVRLHGDEPRLTKSQQFIGTVAYASPEQLTGGEVDARSDVYSMGVVVFELATGRLPFEGTEPMSVVAAHLNRPAPLPSSVCAGLPVWLDVAVGRALAKNPQDRWPDIASLGRAMASQDETVRATVYSPRATGGGGGLLATYEIGEPLGPGRLGSTVHKGVHRALGHPVAIRILRGGSEGARARFLHEARALQVAHPSIIQVRDYGDEGDLVYVVTDFIEGPSMRQLLTEYGALPWPRLSGFTAQLLEAAHVLHRRKGLLCGLSPDIIRITHDDDGERLMISSAGIWDAQDLLGTLNEQTLRGVGLADIELRYVAPELLTGRKADVRSDVFTLGVLIYEMATGTIPFDGSTLPELLGRMLSGAPRDPRELQPTLPERAASAIALALSTAPERRHATARDFLAALEEKV